MPSQSKQVSAAAIQSASIWLNEVQVLSRPDAQSKLFITCVALAVVPLVSVVQEQAADALPENREDKITVTAQTRMPSHKIALEE